MSTYVRSVLKGSPRCLLTDEEVHHSTCHGETDEVANRKHKSHPDSGLEGRRLISLDMPPPPEKKYVFT